MEKKKKKVQPIVNKEMIQPYKFTNNPNAKFSNIKKHLKDN